MAAGTLVLFMLLTEARCMRMTSRNGSRLMYQPGQAAPGICTGETPAPTSLLLNALTFSPRLVSARPFCVASVAGTRGSQSSAMRDDCRYAWPHMMAVTQAA